jgi:hypothetical protein
MSKKKNTLKDLDEFLKQQAATLVPPARLSDQTTQPAAAKQSDAEKESNVQKNDEPVSSGSILEKFQQLPKNNGPAFRSELCDAIIKAVESQNHDTAENRMLINTALYLKGGSQWKEVVRNYWKGRNNGK